MLLDDLGDEMEQLVEDAELTEEKWRDIWLRAAALIPEGENVDESLECFSMYGEDKWIERLRSDIASGEIAVGEDDGDEEEEEAD